MAVWFDDSGTPGYPKPWLSGIRRISRLFLISVAFFVLSMLFSLSSRDVLQLDRTGKAWIPRTGNRKSGPERCPSIQLTTGLDWTGKIDNQTRLDFYEQHWGDVRSVGDHDYSGSTAAAIN